MKEMHFLQAAFIYFPIAVFLFAFLGYVLWSGFSWRAKAAWGAVLLFACLRFFIGQKCFGNTFYPEFSEPLHLVWCWAYVAAVVLAALTPFWWLLIALVKEKRRYRWIGPALAGVIALWGLWEGVKVPPVREIEIAFPNLPASLEGYRILQISDIHCSPSARRWRTERIVEKANAAGADLIVLTGDYVDGKPTTRFDDIAPLGKLHARDGVWCVTGNHEYYFDWPAWDKAYRKLGLHFLQNACVFPHPGLALGGVNDEAVHDRRYNRNCGEWPDIRKAFAAATNGEFRVLLKHKPEFSWRHVKRHHIDLHLAGHTHGGIMPGLMHFVAKANDGYLRGLYETGGHSRLFVSSGSGQWAGFQIRYFDPSEIVLITLRRKPSS